MELFSEFENSGLQIILEEINLAIAQNKDVNAEKICAAIRETASKKHAQFNLDTEREIIAALTDSETNKVCSGKQQIPYIPTIAELNWLKWMLEDGSIRPLLSSSLVKKLSKLLGTSNVPLDNIWKKNFMLHSASSAKNDKHLQEYLRTAYLSLRNNKIVYYESHDEYGNNYSGKAAPYKLEYNFWNNSYNFIMWNFSKEITFKSNIQDITKLELLSEAVPAGTKEKADVYVKSKVSNNTPIVLKLIDKKNNAIERCFTLLANYDKEVRALNDNKQEFELKIYYSDFDLEELITIIHSLGSSVIVMSPEFVRQRIIEEITPINA